MDIVASRIIAESNVLEQKSKAVRVDNEGIWINGLDLDQLSQNQWVKGVLAALIWLL